MPFPTRLKCKISSKLAYPVGAELISSELSDVPQAQNLEVRFYSKYEPMETRGEPYEFLSVSYHPWENYDSGWRVEVRPVPRGLKHLVKEALTTEFFPRIRRWLKKRAGLNSRYGYYACGVIFDEKHEPLLKWRQNDAPAETSPASGRSGRLEGPDSLAR